jgi:hypothetical protein
MTFPEVLLRQGLDEVHRGARLQVGVDIVTMDASKYRHSHSPIMLIVKP